MKKLFHLTPEGLQELQDEFKGLVAERGPVAQRIKAARELGDLSENAEYQSAREEQDRLEARIAEVERVIQNSQLIKKTKATGVVKLGSVIKLKDGKMLQFQVVGTMEAEPLNGKVSDESPIGKALLGKKVGDKVEVGGVSYKITEIS